MCDLVMTHMGFVLRRNKLNGGVGTSRPHHPPKVDIRRTSQYRFIKAFILPGISGGVVIARYSTLSQIPEGEGQCR